MVQGVTEGVVDGRLLGPRELEEVILASAAPSPSLDLLPYVGFFLRKKTDTRILRKTSRDKDRETVTIKIN